MFNLWILKINNCVLYNLITNNCVLYNLITNRTLDITDFHRVFVQFGFFFSFFFTIFYFPNLQNLIFFLIMFK